MGWIAPIIEGAVVFNIHADVVDVVAFHRLVVAQHQDGHRGRLVNLAARYAVAQAAHGHAHAILHLDPVEIADAAVLHVVVAPDDVFPVSSGEFHRSGSQVVEFASGKTAGAAGRIDRNRDVPHSMDAAVFQARIAATEDAYAVAPRAGEFQTGQNHPVAVLQLHQRRFHHAHFQGVRPFRQHHPAAFLFGIQGIFARAGYLFGDIQHLPALEVLAFAAAEAVIGQAARLEGLVCPYPGDGDQFTGPSETETPPQPPQLGIFPFQRTVLAKGKGAESFVVLRADAAAAGHDHGIQGERRSVGPLAQAQGDAVGKEFRPGRTGQARIALRADGAQRVAAQVQPAHAVGQCETFRRFLFPCAAQVPQGDADASAQARAFTPDDQIALSLHQQGPAQAIHALAQHEGVARRGLVNRPLEGCRPPYADFPGLE